MSVAEKDLVNGFVNVCKDFAFGFRKDSLLAIELDNHTQQLYFHLFPVYSVSVLISYIKRKSTHISSYFCFAHRDCLTNM